MVVSRARCKGVMVVSRARCKGSHVVSRARCKGVMVVSRARCKESHGGRVGFACQHPPSIPNKAFISANSQPVTINYVPRTDLIRECMCTLRSCDEGCAHQHSILTGFDPRREVD